MLEVILSHASNDCLAIVDMLVVLFDQMSVLHSEVVMGQLSDLVSKEDVILTHRVVLCVCQIAATPHVIYFSVIARFSSLHIKFSRLISGASEDG